MGVNGYLSLKDFWWLIVVSHFQFDDSINNLPAAKEKKRTFRMESKF